MGLYELSVRDLLSEAASEAPTPGGGSIAALAAALGAALAERAARASTTWSGTGAVVAQAKVLKSRLAELAPANDEAYEVALAALNIPDAVEPGVRNAVIGDSLARAAALPLAIADAAANVAELAALVAEEGDANGRGDARAAALLAEGAAKAAASLVEINLTVLEDDERLARARKLAEDASAASKRALAVHG